MRKKSCIITLAVLLTGALSGEDGFEKREDIPVFDSVLVTSTNLLGKHHPSNYFWAIRRSSEQRDRLFHPGSVLVLTPDQETWVSGRDAYMIFTPVSFKNHLKGFKGLYITHHFETKTNNIVYVALSDTPIEVGEEDVEMIMENGEWKKYETPPMPVPISLPDPDEEAQETPPIPDEPVTANVATASLPLTEDGTQRLEAVATIDTPPSRLWLYALIPLALAILWLAHRKRKHGTKN